MTTSAAAFAVAYFLVMPFASGHAQAPTGTLVNDPDLGSWAIYGPQTNTRISDVKVPGGAAVEVTVPKKPANPWDVAAGTDIIAAVHKGDHVHLSVPMKGKSLEGNGAVNLDMVWQFSSPPYGPIGDGKAISLTANWQTFEIDAVADKDYAPKATALVIHLGTGAHIVDIGPATITNETLPGAASQQPSAAVAQAAAPTGTLMNDPDLGSWAIYGPQTNTRISDVKVPGGAAVEVTVPKKPANPWDVAAGTDIIAAVHKGDHVHLSVPMKGKSLEGSGAVNLDMVWQFSSPPYGPIGDGKAISLTANWQTFEIDAVADKDYAPKATALVIHLGTGAHIVDIGPATITDGSISAVQTPHGPPSTIVANVETTASCFHWHSTPALILPKPDADHDVSAVKDPSVVYAKGRYHIFMTTAGSGGWGLAEVSFKDWADAPNAPVSYLDRSGIGRGYRAAPQVFYFAPQHLWYLIFQGGDPQYSTTADIDDPLSWSSPKPFFQHPPDILKNDKGETGWLDFWNICDDQKCYLFNTDDGGHFFRSETSITEFPNGYGKTVMVMRSAKPADLFEAGMTYKVAGTNKFVTMIEAAGPRGRYFRSWVSDSLDGTWQPLAAELGHPFAGADTVTFDGPRWSGDVSHGELVRVSNDQTLKIDPCRPLRFLYQGVDPSVHVSEYIKLPYRLGLLTADGPNPISAMCSNRP